MTQKSDTRIYGGSPFDRQRVGFGSVAKDSLLYHIQPSCRRTFEAGLGGSGWQGEDISGGEEDGGGGIFCRKKVSSIFFALICACEDVCNNAPGRGSAANFYPCDANFDDLEAGRMPLRA